MANATAAVSAWQMAIKMLDGVPISVISPPSIGSRASDMGKGSGNGFMRREGQPG